jgi:dipeptidyl aminopeptidase/acylaminoacyl peptidase
MRSWRAPGLLAVGAAVAVATGVFGAGQIEAQQARLELTFESDRAGESDIYVMNEDGTAVRRLTRNPAPDTTPFFFPDGERIVFASGRNRRTWQLYTMQADGTNQTRLAAGRGDKFDPVVSRDGTQIAFEGNATGNWDIYVMPADGGEPLNITQTRGDEEDPSFTADGTAVVFSTAEGSRTSDIGRASPAAPGVITRVTHGPAIDRDPDVAANGEIVFSRLRPKTARTASYDLYTLSADGGVPRQLTSGSGNDAAPRWTEDGRVLFDRAGGTRSLRRIYLADAKGGRTRQVSSLLATNDIEAAPRPPKPTSNRMTAGAAALLPDCNNNIYGNNSNNPSLTGTNGRDCIWGYRGQDTLKGKDAADRLYLPDDGYKDTGDGGDGPDKARRDPYPTDKLNSAAPL